MCPLLSDLIVDIRGLVGDQVDRHSSVRRFGVRGFHPTRGDAAFRFTTIGCFDTLFPNLLDRERFPELHTVRLLDYDHRRFLEHGWLWSEARQWANWVERLKRGGVKFEDHDGNLIQAEISADGVSPDFIFGCNIM